MKTKNEIEKEHRNRELRRGSDRKPVTDKVALEIIYRPLVDGDVNFVLDSWLKSYRKAAQFYYTNLNKKGENIHIPIVSEAVYYAGAEPLVKTLIEKADVIVACDPSDLSNIYGYICAERIAGELVIHWIQVKYTYRKWGVGKSLFDIVKHEEDPTPFCTFYKPVAYIIGKKNPYYEVNYDPFLLLKADALDRVPCTDGMRG
jgi:hypothetical protein